MARIRDASRIQTPSMVRRRGRVTAGQSISIPIATAVPFVFGRWTRTADIGARSRRKSGQAFHRRSRRTAASLSQRKRRTDFESRQSRRMVLTFESRVERNRIAAVPCSISSAVWFALGKDRSPGCCSSQMAGRSARAARTRKFVCQIEFSIFRECIVSFARSVPTAAN